MLMWKRKVGDKVVIGDEYVVVVASVIPSNGGTFKGEVKLGFSTPEGTLVQRAETYVKQGDVAPFPQYYRYVHKQTQELVGYCLELPAEVSEKDEKYQYELIAGYDDVIATLDRQVCIYMFRTLAEVEACLIGMGVTNCVGTEVGVVSTRRNNRYLVLVDDYHGATVIEGANPEIRSFMEPSKRVMDALEVAPKRRTA